MRKWKMMDLSFIKILQPGRERSGIPCRRDSGYMPSCGILNKSGGVLFNL